MGTVIKQNFMHFATRLWNHPTVAQILILTLAKAYGIDIWRVDFTPSI